MIFLKKTKKLQSGGATSITGNKPVWMQMNQTLKSTYSNPASYQTNDWMVGFNNNNGLKKQMEGLEAPADPIESVSTDKTIEGKNTGFKVPQPEKDDTSFGETVLQTAVVDPAINGAKAMGKGQGLEEYANKNPSGETEINKPIVPETSSTEIAPATPTAGVTPNGISSFDSSKLGGYGDTATSSMNDMSLANNAASTAPSLANNISAAGSGGIAQQAMGTGSAAAASTTSGLAGGASAASGAGGAAAAGGGGMSGGVAAAGVGVVSKLGVAAIDKFQTRKIDEYGVEKVNQGAEIGKGALKGAATGAAIGSVVPVVGTAIGAAAGAVVGAVGGWLSARKKKKAAKKQIALVKHKRRDASIQEDVANSEALRAKDGMKLRVGAFFNSISNNPTTMLQQGGKARKNPRIKKTGDPYKTKLNPSDEAKFNTWFKAVSEYKQLDPNPDKGSYDYRGYWKDPEMEADSMLNVDSSTHFEDTYKQPSHMTFSDESKYFNDDTRDQAGTWKQDGEDWQYIPYNTAVKDTLIERNGALFRLTQGEVKQYKAGGKLNVIPKGKLHKENNNLGNGDKGIPVVSEDGSKTFELEKEELILHLAATKKAEELVEQYIKTKDDAILEELGKLITDEIVNNTEDKTGSVLKKGGKK